MNNVDKVLQMSSYCDEACEFIRNIIPDGYYLDDINVDENRRISLSIKQAK